MIQNSHFWGRGNKSVRYDFENCDSLCAQCHMKHEGNKQGFYRDFKMKQLGKKGYVELEKRARTPIQFGTYERKLLWEQLKEL
jgi:hypothetical protein